MRDTGGGTIVSFEPVKSNYDRLVSTIHLNKLNEIVMPFNIALGDKEGEIEMALETRNRWQRGATTGNAVIREGMESDPQYTISKARITRLDNFVTENSISHVNFIKIDIEGAELMFLRGGVNFLSKHRPIIYGEFNFPMMPRFNHTFLDVVDIIQPWNYRIFAFADRLLPVEVLKPKVGLGNVFLVPEEKAEELLHRVAVARETGVFTGLSTQTR
jgi:FkbM family methyltransferase